MHNFENDLEKYKNLTWTEIKIALPVSSYSSTIINVFFIRDNIFPKKFINNLTVAKLSMGELLIKVNSVTTPFKMDITKSLHFFIYENFVERPRGYPIWFISCYPDIIHWCNSNPEKLHITSPFNELDYTCLDNQNYLKTKYLRQIVDFYIRNINSELECKTNKDDEYEILRNEENRKLREKIELKRIESDRVANEARTLEYERKQKKEDIVAFFVVFIVIFPVLMLLYSVLKAIFFK